MDWGGLLRSCCWMSCLRSQVTWYFQFVSRQVQKYQLSSARFKCGECWGYKGGSHWDVRSHFLLCRGETKSCCRYEEVFQFVLIIVGGKWGKWRKPGGLEAGCSLAKHFHSLRVALLMGVTKPLQYEHHCDQTSEEVVTNLVVMLRWQNMYLGLGLFGSALLWILQQ